MNESKPINPLRRALRDEMFAVLNQGELTPAMCSTMMRIAESARDLLRAGTMKPEDFKDTIEHVGDQEVQPPNVETFGVKMLKELMPILQAKFNPKPQVDTAQLVIALAEARKHGLKDVAESLEIQLGLRTSAPVEPIVLMEIPTCRFCSKPVIGEFGVTSVDQQKSHGACYTAWAESTVQGLRVDVEARNRETAEREAAGGLSTVLTPTQEPS